MTQLGTEPGRMAPFVTVSVGVPVHNGASSILDSLKSLARQSFADVEFVIFENASTDGTREIVEEFCRTDSRFRCEPSDRLLPVIENFSRARRFLAGRSKYIFLLAADDAINDHFLTHAVASMEAVPGAALVVPRVASKLDREHFHVVNADVLDLRNFGRFRRSFRQIAFPPSWFYGLYRSDVAQSRIDEAYRLFPDTWGGDRMIVLMFLLRGEIVQSEGSEIYVIPNPKSKQVYGPKTAGQMLRARVAYFRALWGKRGILPLDGPFARVAYFLLCWKTSEAHTTHRWNRILGRWIRGPLP